jgi:hypothetical protein
MRHRLINLPILSQQLLQSVKIRVWQIGSSLVNILECGITYHTYVTD